MALKTYLFNAPQDHTFVNSDGSTYAGGNVIELDDGFVAQLNDARLIETDAQASAPINQSTEQDVHVDAQPPTDPDPAAVAAEDQPGVEQSAPEAEGVQAGAPADAQSPDTQADQGQVATSEQAPAEAEQRISDTTGANPETEAGQSSEGQGWQ